MYVIEWKKEFSIILCGPFATMQAAQKVAQEHDQYFPLGYIYTIRFVCEPDKLPYHKGGAD